MEQSGGRGFAGYLRQAPDWEAGAGAGRTERAQGQSGANNIGVTARRNAVHGETPVEPQHGRGSQEPCIGISILRRYGLAGEKNGERRGTGRGLPAIRVSGYDDFCAGNYRSAWLWRTLR